ncbi:UNVERIFIED_CONTAM: hypothetical protein Sindi_2635300 [Sesamum indicum]
MLSWAIGVLYALAIADSILPFFLLQRLTPLPFTSKVFVMYIHVIVHDKKVNGGRKRLKDHVNIRLFFKISLRSLSFSTWDNILTPCSRTEDPSIILASKNAFVTTYPICRSDNRINLAYMEHSLGHHPAYRTISRYHWSLTLVRYCEPASCPHATTRMSNVLRMWTLLANF